LPPVAQAFKNFLMEEGAALIDQTIGFSRNRLKSRN
jgi:hypothetical protein